MGLLDTLLGRSSEGHAQRVSHYLYFGAQSAAASTIAELKRQGFEVEDRASADGKNWLVLAHHRMVPTPRAIESVKTQMRNLAEPAGGEYDGWEAAVH